MRRTMTVGLVVCLLAVSFAGLIVSADQSNAEDVSLGTISAGRGFVDGPTITPGTTVSWEHSGPSSYYRPSLTVTVYSEDDAVVDTSLYTLTATKMDSGRTLAIKFTPGENLPGGTYRVESSTTNTRSPYDTLQCGIYITLDKPLAELVINPIETQYLVVNSAQSFSVSCTPATDVTLTASNVPEGLTVMINGSTITCYATESTTYTFTLTASASGCTDATTTVTVVAVPILSFSNTPSAGSIAA